MNEEMHMSLTSQQMLHIVFYPKKKKRAFYTRRFSIWADKGI